MKKVSFFTVILYFFLAPAFAQNVGIGTVTPADKLHIDSGDLHLGKLIWDASRNYNFIKLGDGSYITIGEDETDDRLLLRSKEFIFKPSTSFYKGYVGIGTNYAPASPLEIFSNSFNAVDLPGLRLSCPYLLSSSTIVSWNIYGFGGIFGSGLYFAAGGADKAYIDASSGTFFSVSDRNLKKNISYYPATGMIQKIKDLKPAHYQMKDNTEEAKYQIGLISQDVEKYFPEVVSDVKGIKMINYSGLIPVAIQGIKEQQQEIEILQKENAELKARLEKLEKIMLHQ